MPGSAARPKLKRTNAKKSLLRFQAIVGLMALAVILAFVAYRFQTKTYITASPLKTFRQRYDRMVFGRENSLAGGRLEGGLLHIRREAVGGRTEAAMEAPAAQLVGGESGWAISQDLEAAAWLTPEAVYYRRIGNAAAAREIPLAGLGTPVAVTIFYDGLVGVVFSDGSVRRWELETGAPRPVLRLDLGGWSR